MGEIQGIGGEVAAVERQGELLLLRLGHLTWIGNRERVAELARNLGRAAAAAAAGGSEPGWPRVAGSSTGVSARAWGNHRDGTVRLLLTYGEQRQEWIGDQEQVAALVWELLPQPAVKGPETAAEGLEVGPEGERMGVGGPGAVEGSGAMEGSGGALLGAGFGSATALVEQFYRPDQVSLTLEYDGRQIVWLGDPDQALKLGKRLVQAAGGDDTCSTCSGTGEVYQEGQIGAPGSGGTVPCPDCVDQREAGEFIRAWNQSDDAMGIALRTATYTNPEPKLITAKPRCWELKMDDERFMPLECQRPKGHDGEHCVMNYNGVTASWPREVVSVATEKIPQSGIGDWALDGFDLVGDEDCGVELVCRRCGRGELSIAHYGYSTQLGGHFVRVEGGLLHLHVSGPAELINAAVDHQRSTHGAGELPVPAPGPYRGYISQALARIDAPARMPVAEMANLHRDLTVALDEVLREAGMAR
jgi:hypothetical protein